MRGSLAHSFRLNPTMYFLSANTFACLTDGQLVFLDLAEDQYYCLGPDDSDSALSLLSTAGERGCDAPAQSRDRVAQLLLGKGLITADRSAGKELAPFPRSELTGDLMGYPIDRTPAFSLRHVLRFLRVSAFTALRLRWLPLQAVIARARRQKQQHLPAGMLPPSAHDALRADGTLGGWCQTPRLPFGEVSGSLAGIAGRSSPYFEAAQRSQRAGGPARGGAEFDTSHLLELVEVCKRLRPLLFSAKNRCLYDSLVLSEFLAGFGQYPSCVIGVKLGPFAAHCWVEEDGVVYNDSVARAAAFTPILAV